MKHYQDDNSSMFSRELVCACGGALEMNWNEHMFAQSETNMKNTCAIQITLESIKKSLSLWQFLSFVYVCVCVFGFFMQPLYSRSQCCHIFAVLTFISKWEFYKIQANRNEPAQSAQRKYRRDEIWFVYVIVLTLDEWHKIFITHDIRLVRFGIVLERVLQMRK